MFEELWHCLFCLVYYYLWLSFRSYNYRYSTFHNFGEILHFILKPKHVLVLNRDFWILLFTTFLHVFIQQRRVRTKNKILREPSVMQFITFIAFFDQIFRTVGEPWYLTTLHKDKRKHQQMQKDKMAQSLKSFNLSYLSQSSWQFRSCKISIFWAF